MALISQTIQALFNGVSQQSPATRSESQCEELINCIPTIVKGVGRRGGLNHVAQLKATTIDANALVHFIDRDEVEKYLVVIEPGGVVNIWDVLTGTLKTTYVNSSSYINTSNPKDNLVAITVADYTFILNKTVTTAMTADLTTTGALTGTVNLFSDLPVDDPGASPPTTISGQYKVQGSDHNDFDHYYVQGTDNSYWKEIALDGIPLRIDASTMPHTLVRNSDGTFTLDTFSWDDRLVGDEDSNPVPSFIGRKLRDVFFHRNRLGVVADENAILSENGFFGNYFRTTTTSVVDTDLIDIASSHTKVSLLNFAVPFDKNLFLFSNKVQFVLTGGDILTPKNVSIDPVTAYETYSKLRPVPSGNSLYFSAQGTNYSTLYEYEVLEDGTATNSAADITGHIPSYIPKNLVKVVGSPNYNMLFALSSETPNTVYAYKYYWKGQEKVQSAWHKWTFDENMTILGIEAIGSLLYVVSNRSGRSYIENINLEIKHTTEGLNFPIHLDHITTASGTYDVGTDTTTFPLLVDIDTATSLTLVHGADSTYPGLVVDSSGITRPNAYTVVVPGDHSGFTMVIGTPFESSFEFSPIFKRDEKTRQAVIGGTLRLRTMRIYYADTAYFQTEVIPYARSASTTTIIPSLLSNYTGKTIGDAALLLGTPVFSEGDYRFPVFSDGNTARIRLLSSSPFSFWFQKADWEGFYTSRTRR